MKTIGFTFFYLIIPALIYSQYNQSFDINGGIGYSFRNISTTSEEDIVVRIVERRENEEKGRANYNFGLNYNKRLVNKIYFKTGIQVASLGYKGGKRTDLVWPSEFNEDGTITEDPNLPREVQISRNFMFIDIPIAGRYEFNSAKLSPFIEIGISPSLYITTQTTVETDIETKEAFRDQTIFNINRVNLTGFLSLGVNYSLGEQLVIFAQPMLRYHITPIANAPIDMNLFKYGIQLGVRKKMK